MDVGPGGDVGLGGRPADAAGGRRLIARLVVGFLGSARAFRHRSYFHAAFGGTLAQAPQRPPEATFTRFPMFPSLPTRSLYRPIVLPTLSMPGFYPQSLSALIS